MKKIFKYNTFSERLSLSLYLNRDMYDRQLCYKPLLVGKGQPHHAFLSALLQLEHEHFRTFDKMFDYDEMIVLMTWESGEQTAHPLSALLANLLQSNYDNPTFDYYFDKEPQLNH